MISSWRRRRSAAKNGNKKQDFLEEHSNMELTVPDHFRCPISLEVMKDPVTLSTGRTYDRESIETWIEAGNHTCPVTAQVLKSLEPIPNHTIRKMIQEWCVDNISYGIERIPTPRIPVTSYQISEILSKVGVAREKGDREGVQELVKKIKTLGKESERNKMCIVGNGAGKALSATFESFSRNLLNENAAVLEELLSALTIMLPFDQETKSYLGSWSLRSMVWILRHGDLSGRRNAVLVLKEILSSDHRKIDEFSQIEGGIEAMVKVIKEPICPTTTKASLLAIYHMVSTSSPTKNKVISRFVDMGLVSMLLEMLVDCDKSICEKALAVLDGICSCEEGRKKAYDNSLTTPVLVKKILRVSDLATEFSVSILWKLSKNEKREGGGSVVEEALQVGAFQKLLLLLQVGSSERTKEKASDLLKLLNLHRDKLECIDSMDFKNLKRPF